jgi:hypothetical protein
MWLWRSVVTDRSPQDRKDVGAEHGSADHW